jgi:hypothetical protein
LGFIPQWRDSPERGPNSDRIQVNQTKSNQIDADERWPRKNARSTKKEGNADIPGPYGLLLRVPGESDQIRVNQSKEVGTGEGNGGFAIPQARERNGDKPETGELGGDCESQDHMEAIAKASGGAGLIQVDQTKSNHFSCYSGSYWVGAAHGGRGEAGRGGKGESE